MKRFIKIALEIKMRTCLIFTGITLVAMACQLIGLTDRVDVLFLWQALLLGFLFALLQYVLVSGRRVGSRGYVGRMALFGGAFLALLAAGAGMFGWLDPARPEQWAFLLIVGLLAFLGINVGFEIYASLSGRRYDRLLEEYHSKNHS